MYICLIICVLNEEFYAEEASLKGENVLCRLRKPAFRNKKTTSFTKPDKGSITVEASLVISLLLFVISALMIFSLILYQKVLLVHTAAFAAQQGAEIWTDSRKSMEDGSWNPSEDKDPLYYQLFSDSLFAPCHTYVEKIDPEKEQEDMDEGAKEGGDIRERKFAKIRKSIYRSLAKGVLRPEATYLIISFENNLLQRKITVYLEQEVKIPFGAIKAFFSGTQNLKLTAEGTAIVAEPAEYIRNIDFIEEYAQRFAEPFSIDNLLESIKQKVFK